MVVKLFLRHHLHAKLYLLFRTDPINPIIGYLGSSNLTLAGLSGQGELNIDVLDCDASQKLAQWFEDRWNDHWCIDISDELVQIIEESWARDELIPPYHIYVNMAYHLSQEARSGLAEFRIPSDFNDRLFEFQKAAVKIAAHHLNKRDGVLIGDVVGLGKTLMATAVARIFQDDREWSTLIICPKNLVKMWRKYARDYGLAAEVISLSQVIKELPNIPGRFRLVLIDESHNLRNREGKRYKAIKDHVEHTGVKCILLTATPYNKTYIDLSNQLRLFVPDDKELGIRPERLLRDLGETEFIRRYQCGVRTLAAFEKSEYAEDWRELMRLYLVRRTRSFIQQNYAELDPVTQRKYLTFSDGRKSYFPTRVPKTLKFKIDDSNPNDQYACLYAADVVDTINSLRLPRYGPGNYADPPHQEPTPAEATVLGDLSRAGKRLMGFCRTNLFKRLESSGQAFVQSVERHILRNYVVLHAIENNLPIPIGTQGAELLDARVNDADEDMGANAEFFDDDPAELRGVALRSREPQRDDNGEPARMNTPSLRSDAQFKQRAEEVYNEYAGPFKSRFKWIRPALFDKNLRKDLRKDAQALMEVLDKIGDWDPNRDAKLHALYDLLKKTHPNEKVLVFTQFADTVDYLEKQLKVHSVDRLEGVTGASADPTGIAWRFSPVSNEVRNQIRPEEDLRVVIATDVLSEGQNLQDAYIVVNYDLPWAIIRLIQRAGRVDRIGQNAENIVCYSFLPADGVERIIRLRSRVRQRLQENAEVVGTDEAFFEDDRNDQAVRDLFTEKAGILDGEADTEVDLASYAYQIWKNAITADPALAKSIPEMPPVVYSTKAHEPTAKEPEGALLYVRTAEGNDALAWVDETGNSVTESQFAILKAAECVPDTHALPRADNHHELVKRGVELILTEEKTVGGQLGRPSGARFRVYERLMRYATAVKGTLLETPSLLKTIEEIYRHPLRQTATDSLNRQMRSGISDEELVQRVIALRDEDRLCIAEEEEGTEGKRWSLMQQT